MFESLPMRDRIVHELTRLDERKRRSDRHWNPYFLGIAFQALDGWDEDLADGMSETEAFAERTAPSREMHGIAKRLGLGLGVERGKWVLPDGRLL
jgi:hypothetical protein